MRRRRGERFKAFSEGVLVLVHGVTYSNLSLFEGRPFIHSAKNKDDPIISLL